GSIDLKLMDQYYNMREKIEPVKEVVDIAEQAMHNLQITPIIEPIRGGTDGAQLSYKGLPTPNIFTGDRKSTRLNSSHVSIPYAVFCLKKKKQTHYKNT